MTEWFEQWFGEAYLRLYPHRDDDDARSAVRLIATHTRLAGARVLDLACGTGRHAVALAADGARVVGFDLSMPLLSRAKHGAPPVLTLVRGDMRRLPFRADSFDMVVNLFTSFGYFSDDNQHRGVLHGAAATLVHRGIFVIDYLNAEHTRAYLVPHEERTIGTQRVAIDRKLTVDGRFVEKEMHLVDDGRSFLERVRLFSVDDLDELLSDAGFRLRERFGDYDGSTLGPNTPRVILIAEKT